MKNTNCQSFFEMKIGATFLFYFFRFFRSEIFKSKFRIVNWTSSLKNKIGFFSFWRSNIIMWRTRLFLTDRISNEHRIHGIRKFISLFNSRICSQESHQSTRALLIYAASCTILPTEHRHKTNSNYVLFLVLLFLFSFCSLVGPHLYHVTV